MSLVLSLWIAVLTVSGFDPTLLTATEISGPSKIPKQIFTYWESPTLPPSVQTTHDNWRRQNPDWQIHVLSQQTLENFLSSESLSFIRGSEASRFTSVGPAQMSDVLRVEVLAQNGGVWLDASVALTESLEKSWLGEVESGACLQGFSLDFALLEAKAVNLRNSSNWTSHFKDGRLLLDEPRATAVTPENWAFATTGEKCEPMKLWRKELRRLLQHPDGVQGVLSETSSAMPPSYRKWLWHVFIGSYPLTLAIPQAVAGTYRFLPAEDWAFRHLDYMPQPWLLGPSLPLDYITDYAGGPMFALARSSKVEPGEPGPPQLGALMKLRKFDRCALDAIIAYRSYSSFSPLVPVYALPLEPQWWPPKLGEAFAAFEANHCGTSDPFLQFFFAAMRGLCFCIFFSNDHLCLTVALCVTCLRMCRIYFKQHKAHKLVTKER